MKGISKKLQSQIPALKKNEVAVFELNGIYYDKVLKRRVIRNKTRIPNTDRIWDPWGGDDGDGAYVDISYVRAVRPAGPNSQRDTVTELEEIYVTRQTAGKVMIHSSNRRGLALYEYLWLCNYNESNKGKDWHVEPAKYYIHQVIKKNDAKKKLEIEKAQDEAKAIIRSMTAEERVNHAKGLFPNAFSRLWSEEEVELKLIEIAKSNPQKILGLSEDLDAAISKAILDFQDHKVVDFKNKKWRYPDSEDVICEVRANESAMDALKRHLLSKKGRKDAENLSDALERAKKNDKQQNS